MIELFCPMSDKALEQSDDVWDLGMHVYKLRSQNQQLNRN